MPVFYDPNADDASRVRLLINDVDTTSPIFTDPELVAFLAMEGGSVKLAAAQALDTIADNEALASKVIRTQDVATDGAKLADSLRKRADSLRKQAAAEDESANGWALELAPFSPCSGRPPELTEWPRLW